MIIAVLILSMQATDAQDLSSVISGLKNLPAPDWVQEGTRMSYYSATADLPSANEKFILDEVGKRGTRSEYPLVEIPA